ncbi:hypothetical protein M569_07980, partial [Genlisea aurea]
MGLCLRCPNFDRENGLLSSSSVQKTESGGFDGKRLDRGLFHCSFPSVVRLELLLKTPRKSHKMVVVCYDEKRIPLIMRSPPVEPRHNLSLSVRRRNVDSGNPPLRLYQVWKGRNKFFCGGRLVFGPDVKSLLLTFSLILAPVFLFWAFVAGSLIASYSGLWGVLIVVISVVLTLNIVILLLLTSGTDPGIIPRHSLPAEFDDFDISSISSDWCGSQSSAAILPVSKTITINGIAVKIKYCHTCRLYRPPRCSHCSVCNNCVERFDHHCPWVGQCIGKRNYRCFFMFVSSTTLLCLYVFGSCLTNVSRIMERDQCSVWGAFEKSPVSGILILYTFIVCWFVGGLTLFHLYLIATNQTTYENFRYQYDQKTNPYNRSLRGNCGEILCSEIPKSRNDFREKVRQESRSSSSVSSFFVPPVAKTTKSSSGARSEFDEARNGSESLERCGG